MAENSFEKEHIVKLPVFGYTFYVVITTVLVRSRKNREGILGKCDYDIPTLAMCSHGVTYSSFTYLFISPNACNGTIAHECYHAICNLFKYIDADHEEEIFAYHLSYLVDEIERVKKIKLPNHKK